jgi:O-antigen/teichoic acid export membrane protein
LLKVKLALLFTYCIVFGFVGWLTHVNQDAILLYVMFIQAFTSLFIFLRGIVTANQLFTADAWFSVLDKLLMISLCGGFIYGVFSGGISLKLFLGIQLACTIFSCIIISFFITWKGLHGAASDEPSERMFKLAFPFALIIFLMAMHYRLDGFLLERIHYSGAYEAGIYASAYRLLDAGNMVGYLAASFLVPFLARHQFEKGSVMDAVNNTRHGLLFFAIGLVTFTLIFAPWIQHLLYHSELPYNSLVLRLCIAALPGYYLVHVYGSLLTATARLSAFIRILILSVLINIILNVLLIPSNGALGCCIAALVSQYFCGVACYITSVRATGISFDARAGLAYLLAVILLLAIFYLGKMAVINVWIILAIAVTVTLILLIIQISYLRKYFIFLR